MRKSEIDARIYAWSMIDAGREHELKLQKIPATRCARCTALAKFVNADNESLCDLHAVEEYVKQNSKGSSDENSG